MDTLRGSNIKRLFPDYNPKLAKAYGQETTAQRLNGNKLSVRVYSTTVSLEKSEQYITFAEDLTQQQLNESTVRAILEVAADGIITINKEGIIQSFNPAAERIFGYPAEEVLGSNVSNLMPTPYADRHNQFIENYLETRAAKIIGIGREVVGLRKDGSEFPIDLAISEIRLHHETLFVGLVRDISQRKEMERELIQAKESAEIANLAKTSFLNNMSHELRTPLNGLFGTLELLTISGIQNEQIEYFDIFKDCLNTLLGTVDEILEYSEVECKQVQIKAVPFDLEVLVESIVQQVARRADLYNIEFVSYYSPDLPRHFIGDPFRIKQILLNILNNAFKFTSEGYICLRLEPSSLPGQIGDNFQVQVSIEDTGIGIPQEMQTRIFEKFTQVDDSSTRKYTGSGLGLAITKELLSLMSGSIRVESVEHQGSTFTLEIPLKVDVSNVSHQHTVDLRNVRILFVDDNLVNRRILSECLTHWDIRHEVVSSGQEALAMMDEAINMLDPFHFVVIDYLMPEMNGAQLAQAIKEAPLLSQTSLILLTVVSENQLEADIKALGFEAYLQKPANHQKLLETLQEIWQCQSAQFHPQPVQAPSTTWKPQLGTFLESASDGPRSYDKVQYEGHVLIVEDHLVNQQIAKKILHTLGLTCDIASSGQDALDALEATHYDLILMDCQMPEMDGFEATQKIRANIENPQHTVPIIAVTACASDLDRQRCLAVGMNDFLSKPYVLEDIRQALEQWLPTVPRQVESYAQPILDFDS